ncbi:hypothetical protein D3C76_1764660 [compost metagenome]
MIRIGAPQLLMHPPLRLSLLNNQIQLLRVMEVQAVEYFLGQIIPFRIFIDSAAFVSSAVTVPVLQIHPLQKRG